jgi:hypothetical protein
MKKNIFLFFVTFIFIGCSYINADLRKETARAIGGFMPDQVVILDVDRGTLFIEWDAATPKGDYSCSSYEDHVNCMKTDYRNPY